ncbi:MAG TPA: RIP metalloprotease RseP [Steroidobacteraceae bacterium]|nr:RIP metalloprotease RseP [Steroidobacteraceae bacterium]
MMLIWYALWYIVAVGFLVIVHEFGHFWVARRLGFKVLRFSIGFGKPLLSKTVGADRTEIVLAPIPMGGYVKMLDEREGPVAEADLPRSYTHRPPWQRILVLFAGPGANVLFAILVLWGMLWVNGVTDYKPVVGDVSTGSVAARAGLRSGDQITAVNGAPVADERDVLFQLLDVLLARGSATLSVAAPNGGGARSVTLTLSDPAERKQLSDLTNLHSVLGFEFQEPTFSPVIGQVQPNGPAARAGLQSGDRIVAVDDRPVRNFEDISRDVSGAVGKTVVIRYRRAGVERTTSVTVANIVADGQKFVGIGAWSTPERYPPGLVIHRKLSGAAALGTAATEAWDLTAMQARLIWRMVLGQVSLRNLSGPIGIAQYAGESAEAGAASFLSFLVLISLAIAFFNLLPIPILDGGQIVFQVAEWVKGRPLSERTQVFGQQIGIALLVLLLGVALFNDVSRQFG